MTVAPGQGDITLGSDANEQLWVYSLSSGSACGRVDGPACVLPSPLSQAALGGMDFVLCGLIEPDEQTTVVVVEEEGTDTVLCRVHDRVWVSRAMPLKVGARPLLRWEDRDGRHVRDFRMAPLSEEWLAV